MKNDNFDALMDDVCVRYGYCGGMHGDKFVHVTDLIPQSGEVTADQFVELVFEAEYENQNERMSARWSKHRKKIREFFIQHMGADVVDSNQLK